MSSNSDDRAFYGWLLYGEPFPFFQDFEEVKRPIMDEPELPTQFRAKLSDYECGMGSGIYMDGNGDYISREEAQAEVDWLNGRSIR